MNIFGRLNYLYYEINASVCKIRTVMQLIEQHKIAVPDLVSDDLELLFQGHFISAV